MCKSNDEPPMKMDLKNDKFEDIIIDINKDKKEKICFTNERWKPYIGDVEELNNSNEEEENENEDEDKISQEDQEKIDKLNEEIKNKVEKKNILNEKIREIEDKMDTMKKILNIDVSEQEYLNDLSKKVNEENIN